jgi:hypothetical protein
VDNRARGLETVCLNPSNRFIRVSSSFRAGLLCSLHHNVFKFFEVGIMAEGEDDRAQDIHQPSNRDVHFWQKYYPKFAEKYSNNIRKIDR